MKLGVVFPQTEIGSDPQVLRDFAQTAEELGFDSLLYIGPKIPERRAEFR